MLPRSEAFKTMFKDSTNLKIYDDIQNVIFQKLSKEDEEKIVLLSVAHAVGTTVYLKDINLKGAAKDCEKFTDSIMTQLEDFAKEMKEKYPPREELSISDVLLQMLAMQSGPEENNEEAT